MVEYILCYSALGRTGPALCVFSLLECERQGRGGVGGAGGMPASPPRSTLTLPYTVLYNSEHFPNFIRELLVNYRLRPPADSPRNRFIQSHCVKTT